MNSVILIPALNPDEKLISYVKSLADYGFERIIVVNDGSSSDYDDIFNAVNALEQCTVLKHEVNRGKGRALKTGMEYYLKNIKGYDGIITGDADGQHNLKNTAEIDEKMKGLKKAIILGSRDFSNENVPQRSRMGNRLTTVVFKLFYGQWVSDTQTGLRGIPNDVMPLFIDLAGERFEYEMNMLIACADNKIDILKVPIDTIYIDENSSSHFNVVKDSIRIYWIILKRFFKYIVSGLSSFIVDQLFYRLFMFIALPLFFSLETTAMIFISTCGARVISSLFNFIVNKLFVFEKKKNTAKSLWKYIVLAIGIMIMSAVCVSAITNIFSLSDFASANIKILVDTALVFVSYTAQRKWVFNDDSENKK